MDCKATEKKIDRISKLQKQKLVDYMAENLEFARGQFNGINSNSNCREQWEALKTYLNSLGGSGKTVDQWKKCWIDLKCGVKKAVNKRRKVMNQTGGGSWADVPRDLNALEETILKIITVDAVNGDSCTPESGFEFQTSIDNNTPEEPEEFLSLEFLEGEEMYIPPTKKVKQTDQYSTPPSTSKSAQKKYEQQPLVSSNNSKYKEALEEANNMHREVMAKLNNLEKQNFTIINKLSIIEQFIENNLK